jgi:RimJ/RimL family protein N-acetyltransferase
VTQLPQLPRPRPERIVIDGRYVRLEPLAVAHAEDLFPASSSEPQRFEYLPDAPPKDVADMRAWIERYAKSEDYLFHTVFDRATGRACGRQSLMRIEPAHGVIEIGNILWGAQMARSRLSTEAFYLAARYSFDTLGYRRFEWKCNDRNEPSKAAALRFGFTFEGLFRQHMVVKGVNRDTAWFSMLDHEWPSIRAGFERWLDPANFDANGQQRARLATSR